MKKAFAITEGKGFHITFDNGVTVSVQFGYGDYCDNKESTEPANYYDNYTTPLRDLGRILCECDNAEIAIFSSRTEEFITKEYMKYRGMEYPENVIAFAEVEELMAVLHWAKNYPFIERKHQPAGSDAEQQAGGEQP